MSSLTHLTHFYPRFKALSGGEVAILQLTKELARMGVKSTVLTRGYSEQCDVLLDPSVEIKTIGWPWNWNVNNHLFSGLLDVWFSPALLSLIPEETDGFIFHSEAIPFSLWWAKRILHIQKPCIYFCYQPPRFAYDLMDVTVSGNSSLGRLVPVYAAFHRWFDQRWVRQADDIWTFSKAYSNWCQTLYDYEKVSCIPPGLDFERFSSGDPTFVRHKWNISDDTIVLVTVNKLAPRKNIDVFLKVVGCLRDQGYTVKGFVVGDGPIRSQLEALAKQTNLTNEIIFTGYIAMEELPHYYAGADVYLFLERNVPFGMTPLEAAAAGTASIAPRGGGALETVVHRETGFLVDDNLSVSGIVECVMSIVQNKKTHQEMKARAREHARSFTWQRYAEQVYENFISL